VNYNTSDISVVHISTELLTEDENPFTFFLIKLKIYIFSGSKAKQAVKYQRE
jgi:hypothetical protein